jgi:copper chaperone NosL
VKPDTRKHYGFIKKRQGRCLPLTEKQFKDALNASHMLVAYEDGTEVRTGNLRCASIDLAINFNKTVKSIKVRDYTTKNFIDVEKAYWVIGGNVKGVMTNKTKWAFAKKENAQTFIKYHGGELATYEKALKTTYKDNDMVKDTNYHGTMKNMKGHNHGHEAPQAPQHQYSH